MNFKRYIVLEIAEDGNFEYINSFSIIDDFVQYMIADLKIINRSYYWVKETVKDEGFYNLDGYTVIDSLHQNCIDLTSSIRGIIRDKRINNLLNK